MIIPHIDQKQTHKVLFSSSRFFCNLPSPAQFCVFLAHSVLCGVCHIHANVKLSIAAYCKIFIQITMILKCFGLHGKNVADVLYLAKNPQIPLASCKICLLLTGFLPPPFRHILFMWCGIVFSTGILCTFLRAF